MHGWPSNMYWPIMCERTKKRENTERGEKEKGTKPGNPH
jgi:hypothetical protein